MGVQNNEAYSTNFVSRHPQVHPPVRPKGRPSPVGLSRSHPTRPASRVDRTRTTTAARAIQLRFRQHIRHLSLQPLVRDNRTVRCDKECTASCLCSRRNAFCRVASTAYCTMSWNYWPRIANTSRAAAYALSAGASIGAIAAGVILSSLFWASAISAWPNSSHTPPH
jgi:hypothetical protein